jgi:hypothetical protein
MSFARITFRLFRFELSVSVLACFITTAAALWFARQLVDSTPTPDCVGLTNGGPIFGSDSARCPSLAGFSAVNSLAGPLLGAMGLLPFAVGGLVGSQLVASEVDRETAGLAWWVAPDRIRWLAERVAVPLAVIVAGLSLVAFASAVLEAARTPGLSLWKSFNDYGLWGPVLIVRGLAALAVGTLIGAAVGRILPALLLSLAIGGLLFLALPWVSTVGASLAPVSATVTPADESPLHVMGGWQDGSGRVLTDDQARSLIPLDISEPGARQDWLPAHLESVGLGIPGSRLPETLLREGILMLVIAAVGFGATAVVLTRRRPR